MKSLSLSTPEVLTRRSRGGLPAVNMWEFRTSEVIDSGSGYVGWSFLSRSSEGVYGSGGDSGWRVVEEEMVESSVSDVAPEDGEWVRR